MRILLEKYLVTERRGRRNENAARKISGYSLICHRVSAKVCTSIDIPNFLNRISCDRVESIENNIIDAPVL